MLHRGQDADDVLLRHLHRPAQCLVRRGVAPCRLDQVPRAEQQPAGLRTAQEFTAAVDDEIGAPHQPWARPFEVLGGGVDHDRDAARPAGCGDLLDPQRSQMLVLAEQYDHRRRRFQCPVEVFAGIDLDDVTADHPHRLVIGETLGARDDHPVDHAVGKRQPQHLQRIVAGDAGGGAERHRCGAAAGDDPQFGPGQFGEAPARRRHQFVEIDEPARRLGHRLAHLRQHQAAAMHRADAAAIDERPHAEGEIGIGVRGHRFSWANTPLL